MLLDYAFSLEVLLKLTLALILGLSIGIDRQLKNKPLGLKTCMVLAVASCLITIVSIQAAYYFEKENGIMMDPMRLAAQIVSGIGFIGAGVILRRNNDVITGLTTAAMIWAASGLGIGVGAGFYLESMYTAILLLLAVNVFPYVIKRIGPSVLRKRDMEAKIVMDSNDHMTELLQYIEDKSVPRAKRMDIRHVRLKDMDGSSQKIYLTLSVPEKMYTSQVYYRMKEVDHVRAVDVEEL